MRLWSAAFHELLIFRDEPKDYLAAKILVMTLDTLFRAESVSFGVSATHKKQLFTEMAKLLEATGALQDTDIAVRDVVAATLERERLGSTGVGNGVAVPHARLEGIERVYGAFALLETPMDYDSIDGRPVDLAAMLIAPTDAGSEHLRALAQISRRLRRENIRARLRAAPNAQSLYICLTDEEQMTAA